MRYCLFLLSLSLVLFSCEKTESPESKQDILRDGKWAIDRITRTHYATLTTDTIPMQDCQKDNRIVFRAGHDGAHTTGGEKCGAELEEYGFTWGLTDADTKMYIYNAESFLAEKDVNATLEELTNVTLRIKFPQYLVTLEDTGYHTDTTMYFVTLKKR